MQRFCNAVAVLLLFLVAAPSVGHAAQAQRILILGDSLTAGYGLGPGEAFPDQLSSALKAAGRNVQVVNAGVSGDTTAGGRGRLGWLLGGAEKPDVVLIELGANDGLRAINPDATRANLSAIIEEAMKAGAVVLLAGMYAPPNLGGEYADAFNQVYPNLAKKYGVVFYPFFLEGVAGDVTLNQPDGIHPTPDGVAVIAKRIMPSVIEALDAAAR